MTKPDARAEQIEAACIERFKGQFVNAEAVGQTKQFRAMQGAWIEGAEWADANPKPEPQVAELGQKEREEIDRLMNLDPDVERTYSEPQSESGAEEDDFQKALYALESRFTIDQELKWETVVEAARDLWKAASAKAKAERDHWMIRCGEAVLEAKELKAKLEAKEKRFPIISERKAKAHPTSIPWWVADLAYSVYKSRYGERQTLDDLAKRGGFYPSEMDLFLPGWRERSTPPAARFEGDKND